MKKIRVLIVDDSQTMRRVIRRVLVSDSRLEVVGEAVDPIEARSAIKALSPDVLILDIEMPRMNGLAFLKKIMQLRPMPVVMFSSLAQHSQDATIQALSLGAVDCIEKPSSGSAENLSMLAERLVVAASVNPDLLRHNGVEKNDNSRFAWNGKCVLIGASTGGVEALHVILANFPSNCPPTVIAQHMPASFLSSFARRLDKTLVPTVRLAEDGMELKQGQIVLAPGGERHLEIETSGPFRCRLKAGEPICGHRPSIDVMFQSAQASASEMVGVILTGMGRDGASGLSVLRHAGALTIGQDEASSVVYGMPKVAMENGGVSAQVPLSSIGEAILSASSVSRVK